MGQLIWVTVQSSLCEVRLMSFQGDYSLLDILFLSFGLQTCVTGKGTTDNVGFYSL